MVTIQILVSMLGFRYTVLLLVIILSLLFYTILMLKAKHGIKYVVREKSISSPSSSMIINAILIISIGLIIIAKITRTPIYYRASFLMGWSILGIAITLKLLKRNHVLFYVITLGLLSLYGPPRLAITERSQVYLLFLKLGKWSPTLKAGINPYYMLFPMTDFISYITNVITKPLILEPTFWNPPNMLGTLFTIAFYLMIYIIVCKLTNDWHVGALAIWVLALNPRTWMITFWTEPHAMLLVLIAILSVINIESNWIIIYGLTCIASVLTHGNAGVILVYLFSIILVTFFIHMACKVLSFRNPDGSEIREISLKHIFYLFTVMAIVVFLKYFLDIMAFRQVFSLLKILMSILFHQQGVPGGSPFARYRSLYEITGSDFVAFSWALPIALVAAYILSLVTVIIKWRTLNDIVCLPIIAMALTVLILLAISFIAVLVYPASGYQQYVAFPSYIIAVIPASYTLILLSEGYSNKKEPQKKLVTLLFIAIVLIYVIGALGDPFRFRPAGVETIECASWSDLLSCSTLYSLIDIPWLNHQNLSIIITDYSTQVAMNYVKILASKNITIKGGSLKIVRVWAEQLINGEIPSKNELYVLPPQLMGIENNRIVHRFSENSSILYQGYYTLIYIF